MRPSLSLKTLLRTPFKTAMTFLLIAAASFALFSRVADYSVIAREMNKIKNTYHGSLTLDNWIPNTAGWQWSSLSKNYEWATPLPTPLTAEQINAFASLNGAAVKTRYMTGGVIRDYRRLKNRISDDYDWGYDYTERFVMEGVLVDFSDSYGNVRTYKFDDVKLLAGDARLTEGNTALITSGILELDYGMVIEDDIFNGGLNIPVRFETADDYMNSNALTPAINSIFMLRGHHFEKDFIETLKPGERYVIIGRYIRNTYDPDSYEDLVEQTRDMILAGGTSVFGDPGAWEQLLEDESAFRALTLDEIIDLYKEKRGERFIENLLYALDGKDQMRVGDDDTIDYVPSFFEKADAENLAKAIEIANITNRDLHTFDIVYTDDIASIPRFNEKKMTITEGRGITAQDTDSCVVSQYFFDAYGLKIGDTLTVELGDRFFGQNAQLGAVAYTPERMWNPVKTTQLKIVGVYLDIDQQNERNMNQYLCYSPNTIFVPKSLLPATPPELSAPGEASIFIDDTDNIDMFLAQAASLAEEFEMTPLFSDGGWANVKESINTSINTSLINASLFVVAAILALILAAYLYIGRKAKDYAIMRALGAPRKTARDALALPIAAIAITAIPVGGVIGLTNTSNSIKTALVSFANVNTSPPIFAAVLCFAFELAFIAVIAALFLRKLGKTPPLALLQGDALKAADAAEVIAFAAAVPTVPKSVTASSVSGYLPKKGGYSAFSHVMSYIFRHMRRVGSKTAISVSIAAVLTGAIGLLTVTKYSYAELFKNIDVKSTVTGFTTVTAAELSKSDLVKSSYFYGNYAVALNGNSATMTLTNNIERYLQNDTLVEYADGFSDDLFESDSAFCVAGSGVGAKLGDKISVMNWLMYDSLYNMYFFDDGFRKTMRTMFEMNGKTFETEEQFQAELERDFNNAVTRQSEIYQVAGIINTDDPDVTVKIFTPPGEVAESVLGVNGRPSRVEYCEAILADNGKVAELSSFLDQLKEESIIYTVDSSYYIDTTELDNIRRVRDLLATLFPIAVTAAVLIGAAAPLLIIIQSAKEAAIMRILGTTKKRACCILAFEQIILCAIGITCAAAGLVIYNSNLFAKTAVTLVMCGLLYLFGGVCSAIAASISATGRKTLELLQIKE